MLTNTWTGGQYSLFRGLLGGYLFVQFAKGTPFGVETFPKSTLLSGPTTEISGPLLSHLLSNWTAPTVVFSVVALGALASMALSLGFRDRIAAIVLSTIWIGLCTRELIVSNPGLVFLAGLLLAQTMMPPRPFGAWDARDRLDPDAGWRMPDNLYRGGWVLLALGYLYIAAMLVTDLERPAGTAPWAGFALLHFFIFNPRWIAARIPDGPTVVFYDGGCGLCHQTIRILLAEDAAGVRFRFAPLDSELFRSTVAKPGSGFGKEDPIPDSVLVHRPGESLLARAEGVLELGHQLGGLWRLFSTVAGWLPNSLLDAGYDFIASIRHRLFVRPEDSCPLLPAHLRDRFSH